jgi:transposase-like protein
MEKRSKDEAEAFYRELLAEQARSGLSTRAFAAARGVPAGTLSSWRHQLKQRDARTRDSTTERTIEPRFVPVSVVAVGEAAVPVPQELTRPASPAYVRASYEVVVGQDRVLRLRLPADFDATRVAALVRAVTSC